MPRKITNQNLPNNLVSKKETQIGLYRKQLGISASLTETKLKIKIKN